MTVPAYEECCEFLASRISVAIIVLLGLAIATPAKADFLRIYSQEGGGFMSYTGGASALQGSLLSLYGGARIGSSFFFNENDELFPATIPFETGPLVRWDSTHLFFGPGGSFNLTGAVVHGLPSNVLIPSTTLIVGRFVGTPVLEISPFSDAFGATYSFMGQIEVTVDPDLSTLFGLPAGSYSGYVSAGGRDAAVSLPPSPVDFECCIESLFASMEPVPEGTSSLLLGTAVILLALAEKYGRYLFLGNEVPRLTGPIGAD